MKFNYDDKTDALYINFIEGAGVDSFEIVPDYIADIDSEGRILGIEVLNVSNKFDVKSIIFNNFPLQDLRFVS
jgi:uncharacterized protein YuzE